MRRAWIPLALALLLTNLVRCSSPPLEPDEGMEFYLSGNDLYDAGDYAGAIRNYTAAIHHAPDHAWAYNNRGLAKAALGDLAGAIEDYDACLTFPNPFPEAYYNRGVAKHQLGRFSEGIRDFTEAIRLLPQYPKAFAGRGLARSAAGDREGALADLRTALGIAPADWAERPAVASELDKIERAARGK